MAKKTEAPAELVRVFAHLPCEIDGERFEVGDLGLIRPELVADLVRVGAVEVMAAPEAPPAPPPT